MGIYKSIIFDYDGTLHDSIKIYYPAFLRAYRYLVSKGYAENKEFKEIEVSKWLGYNSKDMWNMFMPYLPESEKHICSDIIGLSMIEHIKKGKAKLYKESIEVLSELKEKNFNLIFLSNCNTKYMNEHIRAFNLDKYFIDFYCTQQYDFLPKHYIFNNIREKYDGDYIVVGDRKVDIDIANVHNLYSIGCLYGYGSKDELYHANSLVNSIKEVNYIINNL